MGTFVLPGPQNQFLWIVICVFGIGSDDVPSSVPSSELTTVSGIVPSKFFSSYLGSEGTFKESVSKSVPSFRAGVLTYLVEDGTRPISCCSSSFSFKLILPIPTTVPFFPSPKDTVLPLKAVVREKVFITCHVPGTIAIKMPFLLLFLLTSACTHNQGLDLGTTPVWFPCENLRNKIFSNLSNSVFIFLKSFYPE
ncbi:hypothetical protein HAX54_002612 [Datura stramonium]|uniref:Uncharacterized protein n=1 Tax=Datura stramonium TaxID=4076 RepID=A0ABS8T4X4_DATST|nr:hypothetical protein [Datura stramonium]